MHPRITSLTHKGHDILYVDYSRLKDEEYKSAILGSQEAIIGMGKNDILLLVNIENSLLTKEIAAIQREVSGRTKHLVKKIALIGASPLHRILANLAVTALNAKIFRFLKTREEAEDWLTAP
ncbi:MAG: STAS/SEC14 domain-containing protein [Candidatus Firestonebacteria bacterium]|nr:STAS/SEC14 domain-containing protein [Candidatus Firestonebacteria bacterium]